MVEYGTQNETSLENRRAAESVKQRVYLAVQDLCVGEGDVRKRLISAIGTLTPLNTEEFPESLQNDFEWVMKESLKHASDIREYRSDLECTMKTIRNSTGKKIAERILKIYSDIQDIRGFPLLGSRKSSE
jgi:type I restriction-modification system DNA methylase subunit